MSNNTQYPVVVPAAGVGKRMQADKPKQYLEIAGKTILEHTLETLHRHPLINEVVLVLSPQDPYFSELAIADAPWLTVVEGGAQRSDSVLAGLQYLPPGDRWVLVHDAARPCLSHQDLDSLFNLAMHEEVGGILATPVRDTMKRAGENNLIAYTESRENLWHALTPQFFPLTQLRHALERAQLDKVAITDEASAIEYVGGKVKLLEGSARNIKVTHPDDLLLAEFYLRQKEG
ncbi:MAG: 2-C-methyl-D-erythritol 4-phosphate cytidylyltransferase [Paraglaciecola sp.]|jgi:2-C-methyl-D-erythritol 4-phosphate cytidylyltransferase